MAELQLRLANPQEVVGLCQQTIPQWRTLVITHPTVPDYSRKYFAALGKSAAARLQLGAAAGDAADLEVALQLRSDAAMEKQWRNPFDVVDYAEALGMAGIIQMRLRHLENARSLFEESLELLDQQAASVAKTRRYQQVYSTHLVNLGEVARRLRDWEYAQQNLARAINVREQLCTDNPTDANDADKLATSYRAMGFLCRDTQATDQMVRYWEKAIALWERFALQRADAPLALSHLAATHTSLGIHFRQSGDLERAGQHYDTALEIAEKLVVAYPDVDRHRHELAKSLVAARSIFLQRQEPAKAERLVQRALELWQGLAADHPDDPQYDEALVFAWAALTSVRHDQGDIGGALQASQHCRRLGESLVGAKTCSPDTYAYLAGHYLQLSDMLRECGVQGYGRAVELAALAYGRDPRKHAQRFREACLAASSHAQSQGRWRDAVQLDMLARIPAPPR